MLLWVPTSIVSGGPYHPHLFGCPTGGPIWPPGLCPRSPSTSRADQAGGPRSTAKFMVPRRWYPLWLSSSPADISSALSLLEAGGPPRRLSLNRRKCLLMVPEDATCNQSLLPSEIPMSSGGFVLLGSPFGSSSFCTSVVLKRVEKIRDTLSALKSLQDSQIQFTLLRACLALPKISFALRTCAPHLILPALAAFYEGMREALRVVLAEGFPPLFDGRSGTPSCIPSCPGCLYCFLPAMSPLDVRNPGSLSIRSPIAFNLPALSVGSCRQT